MIILQQIENSQVVTTLTFCKDYESKKEDFFAPLKGNNSYKNT